jgi:hypothetical protein
MSRLVTDTIQRNRSTSKLFQQHERPLRIPPYPLIPPRTKLVPLGSLTIEAEDVGTEIFYWVLGVRSTPEYSEYSSNPEYSVLGVYLCHKLPVVLRSTYLLTWSY